MSALVVFESHWGNTEAVARAIGEGLGPDTRVVHTDEVGRELEDADLIVAGAPVIAFGLPRASLYKQIANDTKAPRPADTTHPVLREWLDHLPRGKGWAAAFETRIWWTPRGATGSIESKLEKAGYARLAHAERFVVGGSYGPLRDGELDRARSWGQSLAKALEARQSASA